ncbi:MAG: hypothetical protein ACYC0Q_09600 [Eubacteriales bacterium]
MPGTLDDFLDQSLQEDFKNPDLHRVLKSGQMNAPDGRRLWLGNVRDRKKALTVLDAQGQPQRYGVIKFYRGG